VSSPPARRRGSPAKQALRTEFAVSLASLQEDGARRASEQLATTVLALPEIENARSVMICLSFGGEVDTWRLAAMLLGAGKEVWVPRVDRERDGLVLHRYPCELEELSTGLRQPLASSSALAEAEVGDRIDVALVLGLAFDRRGYRLGRGKGYFDRFLVGRRFPAVGLAFDFQVVDRLPRSRRDVPMQAIVTERQILRRRARRRRRAC